MPSHRSRYGQWPFPLSCYVSLFREWLAKVRSCSWGCRLMGLAMVSGHSRCHVTSRCSEKGSLKSGPIPRVPQWGAADAEIKVPSGENTELKRSPFKAWSRSVYSHTCYAYCQGFLPCLFYPSGPFTCIFSKTYPKFFPVLAVANTWFLCRPAE